MVHFCYRDSAGNISMKTFDVQPVIPGNEGLDDQADEVSSRGTV